MTMLITEYAGYGNEPWAIVAPLVPAIKGYGLNPGNIGPILDPRTRLIRIYNDGGAGNTQVNIGVNPGGGSVAAEYIGGGRVEFRSIIDTTNVQIGYF